MNKEQKKYLLMTLGCLVLGVVLFVAQNFVMPAQKKQDLVTTYVAKQDIDRGEELSVGMFKAVNAPKDSIVEGTIIDDKSISGKQVKDSLYAGEILSKYRLEGYDKGAEPTVLVKMTPDMEVDLVEGDYVRVAIQDTENPSVIKTLFDRKKIQKLTTATSDKKGYYVKLTQSEADTYYYNKTTGSLILNKWS